MLTEHIPLPSKGWTNLRVFLSPISRQWQVKIHPFCAHTSSVLGWFDTEEQANEFMDELLTRIEVAQALGA
jgi:hypothetical protein